jgi:hypothetical protein
MLEVESVHVKVTYVRDPRPRAVLSARIAGATPPHKANFHRAAPVEAVKYKPRTAASGSAQLLTSNLALI